MKEIAQKNYASFVEGVKTAANGGHRKMLVFSMLAGFHDFPGDDAR